MQSHPPDLTAIYMYTCMDEYIHANLHNNCKMLKWTQHITSSVEMNSNSIVGNSTKHAIKAMKKDLISAELQQNWHWCMCAVAL